MEKNKNKKKFIKILKYIFIQKILKFLSDEKYIKLLYKIKMGKKLNLENPQNFNDKLQWLKLYDKNPNYCKLVDKYEVKKYVSDTIGQEYLIKTLGIYNKFQDIDFKKLPNEFVLKCTHDSGGIIICNNKKLFNCEKAKKVINKSLKNNYFYIGREWPYKNVKPRIIVEKYMGNNLNDYKIFCFNGKPKITLVCSNRNGKYKNTNFYDNNWNLLPFTRSNHINNPNEIKKPINFNKMLQIAEVLAKDIPFVRVDLYEIDEKIYFGELTFYPSSGFEGFSPNDWDYKLGELIDLSEIKKGRYK